MPARKKRHMRKKSAKNIPLFLLINLLALFIFVMIIFFCLAFFSPKKIKVLSASVANQQIISPLQNEVIFSFNQRVDKKTIENSFKISPSVLGTISWKNGKTLALNLEENLKEDTPYEIQFEMNGVPLPFFPTTAPEVYNLQFKTGHAPLVTFTSPAPYDTNVPLNKYIIFEFNQKIELENFKNNFFIKPQVAGEFEEKNRQIIFKPKKPLARNTEYMVGLLKGVAGVDGQQMTQDYFYRFRTLDHGEPFEFKNVRVEKIPILMYHNIGPWSIYESALSKRLKIPVDTLDTHLRYISENYNTISMESVYDSLTNDVDLPTNPIVLTFDDGWRSVYTDAFPLLKKYNLKFTIYLITSHYEAAPGYLSIAEVKEMLKSGLCEIGNHSVHHPMLGFQTQSVIEKEIKEADVKLQQDFHVHSKTFSYPGGSYNKLVLEELEKLGYKTAVTVNAGLEQSADSLLLLKRVTVDGGDTVDMLAQKLESN